MTKTRLRQLIKHYAQANGIAPSISAYARSIGLAPSTLTRYLKGYPKGKGRKGLGKITEQYLDLKYIAEKF